MQKRFGFWIIHEYNRRKLLFKHRHKLNVPAYVKKFIRIVNDSKCSFFMEIILRFGMNIALFISTENDFII